jgi:hypothetical protein
MNFLTLSVQNTRGRRTFRSSANRRGTASQNLHCCLPRRRDSLCDALKLLADKMMGATSQTLRAALWFRPYIRRCVLTTAPVGEFAGAAFEEMARGGRLRLTELCAAQWNGRWSDGGELWTHRERTAPIIPNISSEFKHACSSFRVSPMIFDPTCRGTRDRCHHTTTPTTTTQADPRSE